MSYGIVTPARNEADSLERLAAALEAQLAPPSAWVIVDTGSTDDTLARAQRLAATRPSVMVRQLPSGLEAPVRGAVIVRAFHAGLEALPSACTFVVKLDADITMRADYFARLLAAFEEDGELGIASGTAYEQDGDGSWRQRHGTGPGVWGAARMYRRACLDDVLPLEERMGWDTIDLITALVHGWRTRVLLDLPFFHHRQEGERDRSRLAHWVNQGRAAHYLGYRPSYLLLRAAFRLPRDPAAIGVVAGYLDAARARPRERAAAPVRAYVRDQQRLRQLPLRGREAMRRRASIDVTGRAGTSRSAG